jgi:HK97 gp10 family phage protein
MTTSDFDNEVKRVIKKLEDPRDFLKEVGEIVVEDIKHRIAVTKTDPDGNKWEPWATSTELGRIKDGSVALGLLYKSGELLDSIRYRINSKKSITIGSTAPYAEYLQEGTNNMPARPFIGMSDRSREAITEAIQLYLGDKK